MTEQAVLVFARQGQRVLLIRKLRGLGRGKINGPGGRLEPRESFAQAGIREVKEETGLTVDGLQEVATLEFEFTNGYRLDVRAFLARAEDLTPTACEEADPFWCRLDQIPWHEMWADDPLWLPHALLGNYVWGRFLFEEEAMLWADLKVSNRSTPANLG